MMRTSGPATARPTAPPAVSRTLDLAAYRSHPCDVLKPEQRGGFDGPGQANANVLEHCSWSNARTQHALWVHLGIGSNFLSEVYREPFRSSLIFAPRTIAGQPAVVYSDSPDPRYCDVAVGTGPQDVLVVHQDSGVLDEDSCVKAVEFAEMIVRNLRG